MRNIKAYISKISAFSLLELVAILVIVSILASVAVISYRDYVVRSSIASLLQVTTAAKSDVEYAHNQGTVFGASSNKTYVASADTSKPNGLESLIQVSYGCIDVKVDMNDLSLDTAKNITLVICPNDTDENYIDWKCGYEASTDADYITYLPRDCQNTVASIRDTSF